MKALSNTSIAAIFAVGLTILIALLLQIQFFHDKETQTTDEMMLLRYQLHTKYAPIKPDSHIVVAAIDQRTLQDFGRWPFSRSIHGDFLLLLSQEKPRAVGWDIFFTEQEASPAASAPAAPAPADSSSTPSANAAQSAPASASPASTPDTQSTTPVTPPPADTNAAPTTTPPAAVKSTTATSPDLIPIGADQTTSTPAAAAPQASAASTAPTPAPTTDTTAAPASTAAPEAASTLDADDQHFVDAASQYPNMVTAAEQSDSPQNFDNGDAAKTAGPNSTPPPLTEKEMLPTRPLKNVTGDITKLLSSPYAIMPFPELRKET